MASLNGSLFIYIIQILNINKIYPGSYFINWFEHLTDLWIV